jgi:hypothetical protein
MSRPARLRRRPAPLVSTMLIALVVAGCGGTAATPAPTPVPTADVEVTEAPATAAPATPEPSAAPASAPTEPAASPAEPEITTAPAGTFLFGYEDMLAYYQGQGYTCQEPGASGVAAGYTTHICTLESDGQPTDMIGFLVADDGTLGDVFAGVLHPAGGEMPSAIDMIEPLAFVLGATLGETEGAAAANWLAENIGSEMVQAEFNGNTVYTYTVNDQSGVGAFSEVATPAYLAAPAP